MSSLMHKPTGPTLDGQTVNLRRAATANPAFKPEFARSVRMHPVLAGVVGAAVLLLLVAFALRQKPVYSAESLIYIEPFSSKVLADGSTTNFDSTKYESSVAQQMLTAQRVDILTTALSTLPQPVWASYDGTPQTAAAVLQSQLKVARVGTSYQVSIGLKGPDAANTAAIVNAVTTAYLEAGRKDEISQADQRSQLLSEERGRIEDELAKTRAEQTRLGATLGVANPGVEGANPFDAQLDALRSQLVTARAAHDQAAAQLASISGAAGSHASGLSAAANDVINGDPGLGSMKATINQRRAQISSQMAGLTPGNPVYKQDQDELADLDKTLDSMTVQLRDRAARTLQDKLRTDLERSSDVEARINGELARQTASATSASPRLQRAAELTADVQRLTARYAIVDNALHSLQLETTGPGMAHLALAAAVPADPEPNKKRLILLAALPLALLCGLGAAVFARKRDARVYTAGDVDEVLGFAPIAILPARGEISEDVLDEYFLRLAAGVEGAYRGSNAQTFVITPVSAETDIAPLVQALDRKLVALGLGVVILQAATVFEQQEPAATAELSSFDPAFDRHFEGIASTLFARMKAEHDVILLESPALLISAQTEYVARCCDVTLLVAESARTTRGELHQAGVLLQRLNVTGVGSVLEELQLRYADSTFVKGVRALEGRTRTVTRPRPVMTDEPAPVAPVPVFVEAVDEPVAQAEEISAVPASPAWYPVHAAVTPESHEELAPELTAAVAPEVYSHPADSVEVERPAPMALFDSLEKERRLTSSTPVDEPEDAPPARSWLQRIFQREPEPVIRFLPDREDEDTEEPPAPAPMYDTSRFDLPLPVEKAPLPEPAAHQPVFVHDSVPAAQVMESPLREPAFTAPDPAAPACEAPAYAASEPVAVVPEPVAPEPIHLASAPVAPEPVFEEPVAPVQEAPAYVAEPEPVPPPSQEAPAVPSPWAYSEPVPSGPARPLSFHELSQLSQPVAAAAAPAEQHFEPAVKPVPEPITAPEAQAQIPEYEPEDQPILEQPSPAEAVAYPATAPATSPEVWTPEPLNRWDPIPPLRAGEQPWRSSGSSRVAQQQSTRGVWGNSDEPVRIPPTDRWVAAESVPPEAPPAESSDIVLTRRWGLLSRFQQGETFQDGRRTGAHAEAALRKPDSDQYAKSFGEDFDQAYDPEYDRRRR